MNSLNFIYLITSAHLNSTTPTYLPSCFHLPMSTCLVQPSEIYSINPTCTLPQSNPATQIHPFEEPFLLSLLKSMPLNTSIQIVLFKSINLSSLCARFPRLTQNLPAHYHTVKSTWLKPAYSDFPIQIYLTAITQSSPFG